MDLIDRRQILNCKISVPMKNKFIYTRKEAINAMVDALHEYVQNINAAPSVEAEPVRHGHWIETADVFGDTYYNCSCCRSDWTTIEGDSPLDNGMEYCPSCGAKMDEVSE